tara:strand:- start:101 stop:298 length:198 start_codon:yes stop_codon:yes gene_type:complete
MTKDEYIEVVCKRELNSTIESLEYVIQNIYDLIGDLQKGKITIEDIPKPYKYIIREDVEYEKRIW